MTDGLRRCIRCDGRKKMYKTGGIYNHTNTGGVLVDCPLCLGKGKIPKLPDEMRMIIDDPHKPSDDNECIMITGDMGDITEPYAREAAEVIIEHTKKEFKEGSKNAKKETSRTRKA